MWLKKTLGATRMRRYQESLVIRFVATAATFLFVAASLFFFANSWENIVFISQELAK